jgi:nicotinate dehydrogenase medium molybdopterin subunit
LLVGVGAWQPAKFHAHDPETGEMPAVGAISFGAAVAEVEVDTETGLVDVKKFVHVWEVGKAVNPMMVRMQINGGYTIGGGFALQENVYPYYPSPEKGPGKMGDYFMPTFEDYPEEMILESKRYLTPTACRGPRVSRKAAPTHRPPPLLLPFGMPSVSGLRNIPITPEVILRALDGKR